MVFNSVVFLFCFLPLSLLLDDLAPGRVKNLILLAESLVFYCWTGTAFSSGSRMGRSLCGRKVRW